jgi:hypothetical protein
MQACSDQIIWISAMIVYMVSVISHNNTFKIVIAT